MSSFAPPVGSVFAATPRVLLCLLPTGSPMTPASWGVRRISFGYFCVVHTSAISRRASSCHWLNSRRIRRVNPRLCCLFIVSNIIRDSPASTLYNQHPTLPPPAHHHITPTPDTPSSIYVGVVHPPL